MQKQKENFYCLNMKKSEVSEKVKEIRMRQQNWLKQRNEEKQSNSKASVKTNSNIKSQTTKSSSQKKSSEPSKLTSLEQTSTKLNHKASEKINTNEKFKNWLQSRNSQKSESREEEHTVEPKTYRLTSAKTRHNSQGRESSDDGAEYCDRDGVQSRFISPDEFSDLADRIASKVKNELHISDTGRLGKKLKSGSLLNYSPSSTDETCDVSLSSHHCTICSKLMIDAEHLPMLLIPCGHCLCRSCSHGKLVCPVCSCSVSSLACNIMLQQIIQEYQVKRKHTRTERQQRSHSYSPHRYSETKGVNYHDKLQNLVTRLEVLKEEKDSAVSIYTRLTADLSKEQQQLDNICRQEDSICRQIESLKEKLAMLRDQKSDYEAECGKKKRERDEVKKQVSMLDQTIESLSTEIEKVRLLSEGCDMIH